jgi:lipopolysaccharide export system protein LptC
MAIDATRLPHGAMRPPARVRETRGFAPSAALAPRRTGALHSHVVSLLKFLLPAVALGLIALVLLWPQLNPIETGFRLRPVAVSVDDLENLRMVNPRYVGTDAQNQPYTITADQATQVSGDSNTTDLIKPKGDITLKRGTWIALSAETGIYRKQEQLLDLEGNVNLFHDAGYEIVTARAHINLDQGTAKGDDPVVGQGPDMELSGQGFRVFDRGERILVTGQSRLVIQPTKMAPR